MTWRVGKRINDSELEQFNRLFGDRFALVWALGTDKIYSEFKSQK